MTCSPSLLSHLCHPTPAQLALALLVLKSKPIGSSVEDHVSQLRQHIQPGKANSSSHLDSCAFWKQAYEKSEAVQSSLLDRIYELDQQTDTVRNESGQAKTATRAAGMKRKRSPDSKAKPSTNRKWASKDAEIGRPEDATLTFAEISTDTSIVDIVTGEGLGSTRFARVFLEFRRCLVAGRPDGEALALSLKKTCAAADEMLSRSIERCSPRSTNIKKVAEEGQAAFNDLIRIPETWRICYPSLLQALRELSLEAGIAQAAVAAVVLLFQNILGHLQAIVAIKVRTDIDDSKSVRQGRTRSTKPSSLTAHKFRQLCIAFTRLAVHFFEALDLSQPAHNKVLEGLVCVFLDHLGSSLSLIVFANVGGAASAADLLGVLPPRGLVDASDLDRKVAVSTAQHEARYLVAILRHLMLCIERQESLVGANSALSTPKASLATTNSALVINVREKLQNTLLRGIFGDDDEAFKNAIQRPVLCEASDDFDLAWSGRDEPGDWLIAEVWRLLGWNTLAERDGAFFDLAQTDDVL